METAITFDDLISFHGHACPGLALGYRLSLFALDKMGRRSEDEELVAIVENDSCSVDAVQFVTGCTFGKGNLIFRNYGKQVYTFIKRYSGDAYRISIKWQSPSETDEERTMWKRYSEGDRGGDVLKVVHNRKARKIKAILEAQDQDLFDSTPSIVELPDKARLFPSLICDACGEKVMEPKAVQKGGKRLCIPCSEN